MNCQGVEVITQDSAGFLNLCADTPIFSSLKRMGSAAIETVEV